MHRTISLPLQATTCKGALNVAKVQYKLRVTFVLNLPWYGSMEWNMEENFSMEWNMQWKIFSIEWKYNIRNLPVLSSIPYHAPTGTKLNLMHSDLNTRPL